MTKGDEGFTLLEVLVALVIFIFASAALYHALGMGLQAGLVAEREWRAAELAEKLLVQLGRSTPLRDGVTTGELANGQRWTLRIEDFAPIRQDGPPPVVDGHLATLEVSRADGLGPPLRLQTLVLGVKE